MGSQQLYKLEAPRKQWHEGAVLLDFSSHSAELVPHLDPSMIKGLTLHIFASTAYFLSILL